MTTTNPQKIGTVWIIVGIVAMTIIVPAIMGKKRKKRVKRSHYGR